MLVVFGFLLGSIFFGFVSKDSWRNTLITIGLMVAGASVFGLMLIWL